MFMISAGNCYLGSLLQFIYDKWRATTQKRQLYGTITFFRRSEWFVPFRESQVIDRLKGKQPFNPTQGEGLLKHPSGFSCPIAKRRELSSWKFSYFSFLFITHRIGHFFPKKVTSAVAAPDTIFGRHVRAFFGLKPLLSKCRAEG